MVRLPVADRPTLARPAPALTLSPRLLAVNRSGPIFFDLRKMSPIPLPTCADQSATEALSGR